MRARPETKVAVAGDWHGNGHWAAQAIHRLHAEFPTVRTILHAGDFGLIHTRSLEGYLNLIETASAECGIDRILVTPGNHEDWNTLNHRFAQSPGEPVRWCQRVSVLPRRYRFTIAGRTFLSFGGAASVDYEYRTAGADWWDTELPSQDNVDHAIAAGPADILISHETVNGGTGKVELLLASNPQGWPIDALACSALSRARVSEVWNAVNPHILLHGHMHVADEITLDDARQVISLGCDEPPGNIGVFNLASLKWTWCKEPSQLDGQKP